MIPDINYQQLINSMVAEVVFGFEIVFGVFANLISAIFK